MPNSSTETTSVSNEIITGNSYDLTKDEFIYKAVRPNRMIVCRVIAPNCCVTLNNPKTKKGIELNKNTPFYIGEDTGECKIKIKSTTNNPNEVAGNILINGIDLQRTSISLTTTQILNNYISGYGDNQNRFFCAFGAKPPIASGSAILPPMSNPAYQFVVPAGVTEIYLNTYGPNNGGIRLTVGVTPGKTYNLHSTKYTLNGKTQIVIKSQYKTWYGWGKVQAMSSASISRYYAEISWPGPMDSGKPDIEDY